MSLMFLSHIDDVADHAAWANRFGCPRVMHAGDRRKSVDGVEHFIEGEEPVRLDDDLLFIPVPGHTQGSACLLFRDQVLFTGDHLAWSDPLGHLYAFRRACWYDWETQIESMERTAEHRFRWVLPGHGRRTREPLDDSAAAMATCIAWMREQA
ncbi:MAG: MBL fold metallo-hydrolase [Planctomycetota bacterium]